MKKIVLSLLLSASLLPVAYAQESDNVSSDFNISYTAPPACQMRLHTDAVNIGFAGPGQPNLFTQGYNYIFIKCSNSLPFTISHQADKMESHDYMGYMTGVNNGGEIPYYIHAGYADRGFNPLGKLGKNDLSIIGNGGENIVSLIIQRGPVDNLVAQDKYVAQSVIKLSF